MKKQILCCALMTGIISSGVLVSANEPDAFTGSIGIGGLIIDSGNNLNPNSSKSRIDNLNSAADRETSAIATILPRLAYDIGAPEGLKLYLVTEPPIDEAGGFAINLGATYPLPDIGIVDVSAFFTPFEEAWENPYVTGVDRVETDTSKYGVKIGLNKIMGSGFRVNFVYLNDDVDNDIIGSLMPDLARDGAVYSLNMNYSFQVSKTFELRPRFSVRTGDYDGEANSFEKYKFELEARYITGRLMVSPRVYYSRSEYDQVHPVFNIMRDNDSYGVSLMTNYMAPFNWQKWSATNILGYSKGDSNIDFYDTEAMTFGCFLSYHF
ncbi:DUF2860 family protein [Desulfosediminicola flagellatus]|uniref:DUF2860 family protein n=1 Tax=Desulfosediminicola flagellatus TaxID=2569541 RepID=UPI0010AD68B6|nr:DUF2860 family protein [Desulfosediminicola flagellatus]